MLASVYSSKVLFSAIFLDSDTKSYKFTNFCPDLKKYLYRRTDLVWNCFCEVLPEKTIMMRIHNIRILLAVFAVSLSCLNAAGQGSGTGNTFGGTVKLDKIVHDFGDILVSDGPVSATFTATNIGDKPLVIYSVVSSCGCTDVEWTRQPLKPGEKGTIKATYKNDEGGYPFDKNLTVYFSEPKQPVVLRLRGESHKKKLSLQEMYPVRFGDLGFKEVDIKGGNLSQGQVKSGEVMVANLGSKPLSVKFDNVSEGLSLKLSQNPIPAGQTAKLSFVVTADRNHWGKNYYYATPVVGEHEDAGRPSRVETFGRFTVRRYEGRIVVKDTKNSKTYVIAKPTGNAAKAVMTLIRDYAAGNRQLHDSSRAWVGAFQSGRGDATRFREEQIFMLPKWSEEKQRYLDKQYCGKWRLWTDDEMKLKLAKRLANHKAEFPKGYPWQ